MFNKMTANLKNILLFVEEILESSSSDDENEATFFPLLRNPMKRPKIVNYVDVVNQYSQDMYKRSFRLSRETFIILKDMYKNSKWYPKDDTHGGSPPISAEIQTLAFLWFAGNKCAIRDVADRFGIAESTFHKISESMMDFLNDLASTTIKFPTTEEEKVRVAGEFEKISGFPGVIGCIDGTYIPIRTPAHKIKSTYVNRHDMPSVTLQAICDANKIFLDVFTGLPSKIHDARVFRLSFISSQLEQLSTNQYHLLGDAAYPIKEWLITPFRDYGNLTEAKQNFNYKLSATRVKIENAFGLLKQRFRQLMRTDFFTVDKTAKFIISCCVLHNLCLMHEDAWTEIEDNNDNFRYPHAPYNDANDEREKLLGEVKRKVLCDRLTQIAQ